MGNNITFEDGRLINKNYTVIEKILTNRDLTINPDFYKKILDGISKKNKLKREDDETCEQYNKRLVQKKLELFTAYFEGYLLAHLEYACADFNELDNFRKQLIATAIAKIIAELCIVEKEQSDITEQRIKNKLYQRACRAKFGVEQ